MINMKKVFLFFCLSLLLTSCETQTNEPEIQTAPSIDEGSGSDYDVGYVFSNGKVALNGYLEGVKVCWDKNENLSCEEGEPYSITNDKGSYNIVLPSNEDQANILLVAEVLPSSMDLGELQTVGGNGYIFSSFAKEKFISPLTTAFYSIVKSGQNKNNALKTLNLTLGFEESFGDKILNDYVEAKKNRKSYADNVKKLSLLINDTLDALTKFGIDEIETTLSRSLTEDEIKKVISYYQINVNFYLPDIINSLTKRTNINDLNNNQDVIDYFFAFFNQDFINENLVIDLLGYNLTNSMVNNYNDFISEKTSEYSALKTSIEALLKEIITLNEAISIFPELSQPIELLKKERFLFYYETVGNLNYFEISVSAFDNNGFQKFYQNVDELGNVTYEEKSYLDDNYNLNQSYYVSRYDSDGRIYSNKAIVPYSNGELWIEHFDNLANERIEEVKIIYVPDTINTVFQLYNFYERQWFNLLGYPDAWDPNNNRTPEGEGFTAEGVDQNTVTINASNDFFIAKKIKYNDGTTDWVVYFNLGLANALVNGIRGN